MFAPAEQQEIERAQSLIANQRGNGVIEAGEIGKGDDWQAPVSRVLRDTLDAKLRGNILLVGERIQSRASLPVEIEHQVVDRMGIEGVRLAQAHVLAARRNVSREAGKTAHGLGARGIKEIDPVKAVLGGNLLADATHDAIVVRRERLLEVEVLHVSRQVGQRNVFEQALRSQIEPIGRNPVSKERLARPERVRPRIVDRGNRPG